MGQEAKNMLEEQLYKYRASVVAESDQLEKEQAYQQIKEYFDQTENWLYEEGEDAPQQTYEGILKSFHDKMGVFRMWKTKYLQMKAKGGEASVLGGSGTATAAEDEESNVPTDSRCVRGRRSVRAEQSTTARAVCPKQTAWTSRWRPWLLKTRSYGTVYGAHR